MKSFSAFFIALLLLSCGKDPKFNPDLLCEETGQGEIFVRILNASAYELKNLEYQNSYTFNSILPGDTTCYIQLESSWDVPNPLRVTIEGDRINNLLIDILGRYSLEPGYHTYWLYAYKYDEGDFYTWGNIYTNDVLKEFDPINRNCSELEKSDCNQDSDKVNIRLKNATAFDLCNVEVDMNNQDHVVYGNLASGETSCYLSFNLAKKYPLACTFVLGDEEYIIENPSYYERIEALPPGKYTYNISLLRPITKLANIQMSNN